MKHTRSNGREGFALLTVILVLAALLMLLTPFLVSARNTDQGSAQLYDRAVTRAAIETARLHVRAELEGSHFGVDPTAYSDSIEELTVTNRFPEGILNASDHIGVMWDVEVTDLAGRVDLSSAPPQLISNLMGTTTRFTRPVEPDDDRLPVAGVAGLPPSGVVVVGGEIIHYGAIEGSELVDLERGVGASYDEEGNPLPGPWPPRKHGVGAPVIDQRAQAPVRWRMDYALGDLRPFTTPEQLEQLDEWVLDEGGMGLATLEQLRFTTTVYAGVGAGSVWQRPMRVTSELTRDQSDVLRVDSARYVNEGSTVRIRDGEVSEIFLVTRVSRSGDIYLDRAVDNDYDPYTAVAEVLVRRPVNINTAPLDVLQAVMTNLQIRGRNDRITETEARELAALIGEMRPFDDFEDFLTWVVLPAAGIETLPNDAPTVPDALAGEGTVIDAFDALALYTNALNANDSLLSFSTVPFSLRSRDVYRTDLRAMVNAPSGVARFAEVREEVSLIVPQEELLHVWRTQEDFDEALRSQRNAPWWCTGPETTSQFDGEYSPPSRLWPAMGTHEGRVYVPGIAGEVPEDEELPETVHTFPADEGPEHWAQLWPTRVDETGERSGRVMHFDRETRDIEGRSLLDEVIAKDPQDSMLNWSGSSGLMRQIGFSLWVKPRSHADGRILDVGGGSDETDRLSLMFEQGELVLRVIAAGGDHSATSEKEYGECRFTLAAGDGPGLPIDTWSHIAIDVRGCAPSQMLMLVNGTAHGVKTPGLTRLTGAVGADDTFLPLEDTTGFPQRGVARVGNELVEYVLSSGGLDCRFSDTGAEAGFGGRNARCRWVDGAVRNPENIALLDMDHAAGTPVEIYGYSSLPITDVPSGSSTLPDELGRFRVACVKEVEGGQSAEGDPILVSFDLPLGGTVDIPIGFGMTGSGSGVTGLRLAPAEDPEQTADSSQIMEAFSQNGGYAAIIQQRVGVESTEGDRIGGIEIVRYSGWTGDVLQLAARGDSVSTPNFGDSEGGSNNAANAFVVKWIFVDPQSQTEFQSLLRLRTFVVPISVPVPGTSGVRGFLQGAVGQPEFAQLTRLDEPEQTEWIAYNWFDEQGGFLVRDDNNVLSDVYGVLTAGDSDRIDPSDPPVAPGSPGTPGGSSGAGTPSSPGSSTGGANFSAVPQGLDGLGGDDDGEVLVGEVPLPDKASAEDEFEVPGPVVVSGPADEVPPQEEDVSASSTASSGGSSQSSYSGSYWQPFLGENDDDALAITRAVRTVLQHRGVLGTASQSHPVGTSIVPVFRVNYDESVATGVPGRFDQAFVFGPTYDHLGWPVEVHRAHAPSFQIQAYSWEQADETTPVASAGSSTATNVVNVGAIHPGYFVALTEPQPEPIPSGPVGGFGGSSTSVDARGMARIAKFPSGERPRLVASAMVGGDFRPGAGGVPEVYVDEVLFSDTDFGTSLPFASPDDTQGAQLILLEETGEDELVLTVRPRQVRVPLKDMGTRGMLILSQLPSDAGLLYVGTEILAYDSYDPSSGVLTLAPNGRGLLGTDPQPHAIGEPVTYLSHFTVTTLSAGISGDDGHIPLEDTSGFPSQGTLLIGDELVHYTRFAGGGVAMPRRSTEPGRMDEEGSGIFRGRYGTTPTEHGFGEPVILFPARYWDRWAERANAPEMAYFEFELNQPAAYWTGLFFEDEPAATAGAELFVLQRSDPSVPWDADPESTDGLDLFRVGLKEGRELPVHVHADRIQWRVFVNYPAGAFDPNTGASHSWRTTPRLRRIGAFYYAPSLQLRSVER